MSEPIELFSASSAFGLLVLSVSREMFGKSWFSLGIGEKAAVEQAAFGLVSSGCQILTPQYLASLKPGASTQTPVGFQPPPAPTQANPAKS